MSVPLIKEAAITIVLTLWGVSSAHAMMDSYSTQTKGLVEVVHSACVVVLCQLSIIHSLVICCIRVCIAISHPTHSLCSTIIRKIHLSGC